MPMRIWTLLVIMICQRKPRFTSCSGKMLGQRIAATAHLEQQMCQEHAQNLYQRVSQLHMRTHQRLHHNLLNKLTASHSIASSDMHRGMTKVAHARPCMAMAPAALSSTDVPLRPHSVCSVWPRGRGQTSDSLGVRPDAPMPCAGDPPRPHPPVLQRRRLWRGGSRTLNS